VCRESPSVLWERNMPGLLKQLWKASQEVLKDEEEFTFFGKKKTQGIPDKRNLIGQKCGDKIGCSVWGIMRHFD
jgi:hypothetical protein